MGRLREERGLAAARPRVGGGSIRELAPLGKLRRMPETSWSQLASELTSTLHLAAPPLAITFSDAPPEGVAPFSEPDAGRAARRPHRTRARRLRVLDEGDREHVQHRRRRPRQLQRGQHDARLQDARRGRRATPTSPRSSSRAGSRWTSSRRSRSCTRSPARSPTDRSPTRPIDPDVVFLRVTGRQLMVLSDAIPGLRIEGKPQCHIVAIAKEEGVPAASVGCALSRVRTGMPPTEMTCALPASQLAGDPRVDQGALRRRQHRRPLRRRRRAPLQLTHPATNRRQQTVV